MKIDLAQTRRACAALALAVPVALVGAGCADQSGSNDGGGSGLDAGATKADYQKAFESLDQMSFNTQVPGPKGSSTVSDIVAYLDSVSDWSGGKIEFEIAYSNAVAEPAEQDDALVDGRLDLAPVLPIYDPSEYPVTNFLIEGGLLSTPSPVVGVMQSNAWPNEVALNTEELVQEWQDHGLQPMVPFFNSGPTGLFCSDQRQSLADLAGLTTSAGGTAGSHQMTELGASPVSTPYGELFESLNRGVVDCALTPPGVATLSGILPSAPHAVIDPEATMAIAPGGYAFSKSVWDELPLVVQQLFWDRLDVFVTSNVDVDIWPTLSQVAAQTRDEGGEVAPFAEDARNRLLAINEATLEGLRSNDDVSDADALVDRMTASAAEWTKALVEMGYQADVPFDTFDQWQKTHAPDTDRYAEAVTEKIFAPHRPS